MSEGNMKPFEFENKSYTVKVTDKEYQVVSKLTGHVEYETRSLPEAMKVCTEFDMGLDYFLEGKHKVKGVSSGVVMPPEKKIIM